MATNLARIDSHPLFTEKRYLEFERFSRERHEFLDGSVYAMAGESPDHSTICYNLIGAMRNQLRGTRCRGYSPNMKIATNESGLFSYPDFAVVCGTPTFFDGTKDVVTNPVVIFEVLSPSTQSYDRGEKFLRYTNNIASLKDYLLVSQDKPMVEHYSKAQNEGWTKTEVEGLDSVLTIPSIVCEIKLSDLYELIDFTAE